MSQTVLDTCLRKTMCTVKESLRMSYVVYQSLKVKKSAILESRQGTQKNNIIGVIPLKKGTKIDNLMVKANSTLILLFFSFTIRGCSFIMSYRLGVGGS